MFTNQALRKLIGPLFLDQVLLIMVSILSTFMIARAGVNSISGVSLVDMVNMLILNILIALASGGSVVISQFIGQKSLENAQKAAGQLVTFNFLVSTTVSLLLFVFSAFVLNALFGAVEIDVMKTASLYFMFSIFSFPFYALYNSGAAIFRSMGNSKIPMMSSLMMNLLNLAGNAIGVLYFNAGVSGIGLATIGSRAIAAAFILVLAFKEGQLIHLKWENILKIDRPMLNRILKIAVPNGIENGILQLGRVMLVSIIAGFGTTQIAANGITNSLVLMPISFAQAMNLAIVTIIGQCVGSNDYVQVKYYMKKLIIWTYVGSALLLTLHTLALPALLSFYHLAPEISDLAYKLILIHNVTAFFLFPMAMTFSNALRATGDAKFTMMVSIGAMFAFRLVAAYVFGVYFGLGVIGIWIAMIFDWLFRTFAFSLRYRSMKWMNYRVV